MEASKKANKANIYRNEIEQSELFSDKMFEKTKFQRSEITTLNQITKTVKVLIGNKPLQNKSTLIANLSDEIYRNKISMLREELKCMDFIIKVLLQTFKEIKIKLVSVPPMLSQKFYSKANTAPANS